MVPSLQLKSRPLEWRPSWRIPVIPGCLLKIRSNTLPHLDVAKQEKHKLKSKASGQSLRGAWDWQERKHWEQGSYLSFLLSWSGAAVGVWAIGSSSGILSPAFDTFLARWYSSFKLNSRITFSCEKEMHTSGFWLERTLGSTLDPWTMVWLGMPTLFAAQNPPIS